MILVHVEVAKSISNVAEKTLNLIKILTQLCKDFLLML